MHPESPAEQQRLQETEDAEQTSQDGLATPNSKVEIFVTAADSDVFTDPETTGISRKNRCLACNKKVGLTGFGCRCGGLFCSTHRYSDMHSCEFDYKEHAQGQIRKNNPVVAGKKIAKI